MTVDPKVLEMARQIAANYESALDVVRAMQKSAESVSILGVTQKEYMLARELVRLADLPSQDESQRE